MTIGERLLSLTVEYCETLDGAGHGDGLPATGRPIAAIAKDYENALRELLA